MLDTIQLNVRRRRYSFSPLICLRVGSGVERGFISDSCLAQGCVSNPAAGKVTEFPAEASDCKGEWLMWTYASAIELSSFL